MGRNTFAVDWIIVIPLLFLSLLGLLIIASTNPPLFFSQLFYIAIGSVVFIMISRIDYRVIDHFWILLYGVSLLLLISTFIGPEIRGSTRWLVFGGIRLQPSELVKPLVIAALASFFSRYPAEKLRNVVIGSALVLPMCLLILKQPDLGNALVYAGFFLSIVFVAGINLKVFLFSALATAGSIPFSLRFLKEYQRLRLVTFFTPSHDPQGAGYNALQAMIAVGSGKLWGRGFGHGIQSHLQFLPEYHTDFIFASFIEEFGLLGGMALLSLLFVLLWSILRQAHEHAPTSFERLFCAGLFAQIFIQALINIGMNIGIVPITGITLPFVSYGGSSVIASFIAFGILISIRSHSKNDSALAIG